MTDPSESPEAFAARVVQHVVDGGESESAGNIIRARDAAIRAEAKALRAALETLAVWWGGADHRRDECPEESEGGSPCDDCLMTDTVEAALADEVSRDPPPVAQGAR